MICAVNATIVDASNGFGKFSFNNVEYCPQCNTDIVPTPIYAVLHFTDTFDNGQRVPIATVLNFCPKCKNSFITTYNAIYKGIVVEEILSDNIHVFFGKNVIKSEPSVFCGNVFSDYIMNLSPTFIEIYNQSENAEAIHLDQIAGMGYRKALEFLVKDYIIHKHQNDKSIIGEKSLSFCINNYINNQDIKILAEKSAWLGNDETHYVKKHTDRDVSDLKKFINACANYIEMELTVEDANTIKKI